MGCHALQGIIPIEGSNPGLLHYRQILYHLSLQGVGNLFFLQGIIPTHELDRGLLHCRQILYQLSYQGGPIPHYTRVQTTELQQQECILR